MGKKPLLPNSLTAPANGTVFIGDYKGACLQELIRAVMVAREGLKPEPLTCYFGSSDDFNAALFSVFTEPFFQNHGHATPAGSKLSAIIKTTQGAKITTAVLHKDNHEQLLQTGITEITNAHVAKQTYDTLLQSWIGNQHHAIRMGVQTAQPWRNYALRLSIQTHRHDEQPKMDYRLTLDFKPITLICKQYPEEFIRRFALFIAYFKAGQQQIVDIGISAMTDTDLEFMCVFFDISYDLLQQHLSHIQIDPAQVENICSKIIDAALIQNENTIDKKITSTPKAAQALLQQSIGRCLLKNIQIIIFQSVCLSFSDTILHPDPDEIQLLMAQLVRDVLEIPVTFPMAGDNTLTLAFNYTSTIQQLMLAAFNMPSNALALLQIIHDLLFSYQIAAHKAFYESDLTPYIADEQSFWKTTADTLVHINQKNPATKGLLAAWQLAVHNFAKNVAEKTQSIMDKNPGQQETHELKILGLLNNGEAQALRNDRNANDEYSMKRRKAYTAFHTLEDTLADSDATLLLSTVVENIQHLAQQTQRRDKVVRL
jgi:hypothetical protein